MMSEYGNGNGGPPPYRKKRIVRATIIDHTYTDYSTYIPSTDDLNEGHSSTDNFPRKLHYILSTPEYHHIISWMPHGRAWKIWNRELLVSVVCKEQFKHEKFESFNRQVNGWGFKRLFRNGPDYKCYYNQFFLRGLPDLTCYMHRLDKPGKRLPNKLEEPDLYEISTRFPLPETNASSFAEAPIENVSSMPHYSNSFIVPYRNRLSREQCQAQRFRVDCTECSSSYEALEVPSYASSAPELFSRGSSQNNISQWRAEPRKEHRSLHQQNNPLFPGELEASNTYYSYQTSEFVKAPSNSIGREDGYNHHWEVREHHESPRPYNKPTGVEVGSNIIDQQKGMLSSYYEVDRPMKSENNPLYYSIDHDNAAVNNETVKESYFRSTDYWCEQSAQRDNDWYPAQQQHYYVQRYHGHFDLQYRNASRQNGFSSNFNYAQPSRALDNPPPVPIQDMHSHSTRSHYHHHLQDRYEDRYQALPEYVQDTRGLVKAYNDPPQKKPRGLVHTQHYPSGMESHHQWQAQHVYKHADESGSHLHEDHAIKSRREDLSFQYCGNYGKTRHDTHSLSPLSRLIDSIECEPSPPTVGKK